MSERAQISASILNADFSRLGDEVERAADGGVDSIHLDVMDGQFVDNLTMGPVVIQSHEKRVQPREDAAKPLDEVREHPWRMTKQELPLCPWRTLEL